MNELALFAGAGGGVLASKLLGWTTVGAVEIEDYPRQVLLQRQRDGILEPFPIWDDVRTFDGRPWKGLIGVISGGFPCQDISVAKGKGEGLAGSRSGLWFEYQRIIDEVRPRFVFAENSPNLRTKGLGTIIEGLTRMGYGVRWGVLGAWHVGANHKRNRMWVLAHSDEKGLQRTQWSKGPGSEGREISDGPVTEHHSLSWWKNDPAERSSESEVGRVAHGVANRVDRIKALGNGQVPQVAATAFRILSQGLIHS